MLQAGAKSLVKFVSLEQSPRIFIMKYIFPLLLLAIVQCCIGMRQKLWRETASAAQISKTRWQLHSTNPDRGPGKRSRINEKMLSDAQKLRDEVLSMEAEKNVSTAVDPTYTATQLEMTMAQFVSKFPEARKRDVDAAAAAPRIVEKASTDVPVPYKPVHASQDQEAARKSLIGKLSGEAQTEPRPTTQKRVKVGKDEDAELTELMKALRTSTDPASLIFPFSSTAFIFDAYATSNTSHLPSLTHFYEFLLPWRVPYGYLIKFMIRMALLDSDRKVPQLSQDAVILEMAAALTVVHVVAEQARRRTKERGEAGHFEEFAQILLNGVTEFRGDTFLRADYIRFRVTGEIPSIDSLEELSGQPRQATSGGKVGVADWRAATLRRLNVNVSMSAALTQDINAS